MLNREKQTVQVIPITTTKNEYGEMVRSNPIYIEMVVKVYSHTNSNDIRYTNTELIGLTKAPIDENCEVVVDSKKYKVKRVIQTAKYNQVFMER